MFGETQPIETWTRRACIHWAPATFPPHFASVASRCRCNGLLAPGASPPLLIDSAMSQHGPCVTAELDTRTVLTCRRQRERLPSVEFG